MNRIYNKISFFLYNQNEPFKRLALLRISISIVIFIMVFFGDSDAQFYVDNAQFLYKPVGIFDFIPILNMTGFLIVKWGTIISALLLLIGFKTRITSILLAVFYLIFSRYISFFDSYWLAYVTHLNFFTIVLCFTQVGRYYTLFPGSKTEPGLKQFEIASFIISAFQFYVALLYLQTFTAKFMVTGPNWFYETKTTMYPTIVYGTDLGRFFVVTPLFFKCFSIFTGIFEGLFFPLFLYKKATHRYLGVLGIAFHVGVYAIMGISFYMLYALYPALFIIMNKGFAKQKPEKV